jgi:hypothetical protein
MLAYHNWWHLALFHLDRGEIAEVLRLFDEGVAGGGFGQAMELVDGAAVLWRLHALGHDVGDRWARVAPGWQARAGDGAFAFNDLHAMMTFTATGDTAAQRALLASVARSTEAGGTNAMMAREVGMPACRGIAAFGEGDYAEAVAQLLPLRGKSNRFGGSHAQRDVLSWTLVESAIRLGDRPLAEGLLAERLAAKPDQPRLVAPLHRADSAPRRLNRGVGRHPVGPPRSSGPSGRPSRRRSRPAAHPRGSAPPRGGWLRRAPAARLPRCCGRHSR